MNITDSQYEWYSLELLIDNFIMILLQSFMLIFINRLTGMEILNNLGSHLLISVRNRLFFLTDSLVAFLSRCWNNNWIKNAFICSLFEFVGTSKNLSNCIWYHKLWFTTKLYIIGSVKVIYLMITNALLPVYVTKKKVSGRLKLYKSCISYKRMLFYEKELYLFINESIANRNIPYNTTNLNAIRISFHEHTLINKCIILEFHSV